jgi:hypothetical protein
VRVGDAVSVGGRVAVCVGKTAEGVGVTVGYGEAVAEGSRLGVGVGAGETRRFSPPHAMSRRVIMDM